MGNKITRISRRTFKNKKKKSKNNDRHIIKDRECQCSIFPNIETTPTCRKCVTGFVQEIEINRSNGKPATYSGHWGIIDHSTLPSCGAQFDAKKFDRFFKSNQQRPSKINASVNDGSQSEDAQSDSFQSDLSEKSKKHSEALQDDDNNSNNNSYSSIFDVFEKFEYDALLNTTALDEMFFYPAFGEIVDCDEFYDKCDQNKKPRHFPMHFSVEKSSFSATDDEKQFDETNQVDDTFDETHIYDTVADSEEFDIISLKGIQRQSVRQLKSLKPDDDLKSKKQSTQYDATKQKYIPFNATQFDTRQINITKFDGILFNDSQFDAKYFDATQFDVTPFFVTQLEKSQNSASKLDPSLQLDKIRPFKESQFNALEFEVKPQFKSLQSNERKSDEDELFNATENQRDDAKLYSTPHISTEKSEYEAALIRTAQYVASHFGSERLNDTNWGAKELVPTPFRTTQFIASQFDAKLFDVSHFSLKQFDATRLDVSNFDATQFSASQFNAKAFNAKCGNLFRKCSRFEKSQIFNDNYFNVTQFDARLFNATQYYSRQVYAT